MDAEKTMQFVLEQQAQFATDLTQVKEILLDVARAQERTNAIVATLAERHVELAERHADLAERHAELAQQQKTTEQALHVLISTVERHIASHK